MLKRKQALDNAEWLHIVAHIREIVNKDDLDKTVDATVSLIRRNTEGKRAAYAWSGGKDSVVLDMLCQKAGIQNSLFVHSDLEYPVFLRWCMEHKPKGCAVINTHQDLDWLAHHPEMLFPKDSSLVYRWYRSVQQAGIRQYFRENDLDMMIVGHRKADGNYVGKNGLSVNREGVTRFSPMADWPHEYILAAVDYYGLELPPIYGWKNGYRNGTHSWPCRLNISSPAEGWKEIYDIDPSIVIDAARKLESAKTFLEGVGA